MRLVSQQPIASLTSSAEQALQAGWRELDHLAGGDPVVRAQAADRYEDQGRSESRVRHDYIGRYPIELLQNAQDACAAARIRGSVEFVVTDTALLVANEGEPFVPKRIRSLVRLGSSEKAARRGARKTIGYKGVGFTSAFEISDRPQIIGRTVSFGLDRQRARTVISERLGRSLEDVPARGFPFALFASDWKPDADVVRTLFERGATTVVRLPFRNPDLRDEVQQQVRESIAPETMLFMPHLGRLSIRDSVADDSWSRSDGRSAGKGRVVRIASDRGQTRAFVVRRGRARISPEAIRDLDDPLWSETTSLDVGVAIPWRGRPNPAAGPQRLHVYFPTEDVLGRAVLVHGDFYAHSSRRHIEGRGAGGAVSLAVAERAAELLAELAESLVSHGGALLACLAETEPPSGFGQVVSEAITERLVRARIARPADGSRPRPARDVARLGLGRAKENRLLPLLAGRREILQPGDDIGAAEQLLETLGSRRLSHADIAERIDCARSGMAPEAAIALLARWVLGLDSSARDEVIAGLAERRVLVDVRNRWRLPKDLLIRSEGSPELPSGVVIAELKPPEQPQVWRFVRLLDVKQLTLH
ncbi:MAG: ATP-binding region ATPase domain protein, partial [Aeromicrobium sp.]|nr:ATP-binding region ATPase domain protein [Aeromicrobium sp.]